MSVEATAPESDLPATEVAPLPARERLTLLTLASLPLLLFWMAAPYQGLIGLPVVFFLKNRLHLDASATARFAFITAIPLFIGFVFGFIRDRWSPFGRGDRGHLLVFGLLAGGVYAALAFAPPAYGVLMAGGFLITALMQFVSGAANGLASGIGRKHAMSGQMSTAMNIAANLPQLLAYAMGGALSMALANASNAVAARTVFLIGAALLAAIAAFGAFGPKRVFDDARHEPASLRPLADVGRLLRTWAVYPAMLVQLMWQFAPGFGVAMQYHLASDLKATDAQVGVFYAIFYGSFLPVYLLYGWLAQRFSLRVLMWVGAVLAVPQMAPLLFIHTPAQSYWAAVAMGLLGGIGQPAFMDLAMRSTPKGLEGSMMMLLWTMYWIAVKAGDLWGADLFDHHGGFNTTLWATIAVYAAILPVLLFVPRRVVAGHDA